MQEILRGTLRRWANPADTVMALLLTEAEVAELLSMGELVEAVERGFRCLGEGTARNTPRSRSTVPEATLHVMHASVPALGVAGVKSYASTPKGARFVAIMFSLADGEPLLIAEADRLGQMRTGAASGVATRYLSREESSTVALIGTGWQARSQAEAIACVRPISLFKVFGLSAERREAFAVEMSAKLKVRVEAAGSAEEAVEGSDVVVTATNSREPVLRGAWLRPGVHINAIGSNAASRRELDAEAVRRSDLIVADSVEQARIECGDLLASELANESIWDRVGEMGAIVAGRAPGRRRDAEITLFESQGIATEDVMALELLYRRAKSAGTGRQIPLSAGLAAARRDRQ